MLCAIIVGAGLHSLPDSSVCDLGGYHARYEGIEVPARLREETTPFDHPS
jgi:hypothetical protein